MGKAPKLAALADPATHHILRRKLVPRADRREYIDGLRVVEVTDLGLWSELVDVPDLPDSGGPAWEASDDFSGIRPREDSRPLIYVSVTAENFDAGVPMVMLGESIVIDVTCSDAVSGVVIQVLGACGVEPLVVALSDGFRRFDYVPHHPGEYTIISSGSVRINERPRFRVARAV